MSTTLTAKRIVHVQALILAAIEVVERWPDTRGMENSIRKLDDALYDLGETEDKRRDEERRKERGQ